MNLAIALVALFAISQFLIFGVLLVFAIQFVRVKDAVIDLQDDIEDVWESLESIAEWTTANDEWRVRQETWAESVTELQGRIVEVLKEQN